MKYGIMGFSGRMGKLIQEVFKERGHELVYRCDLKEEFRDDIPQVIVDFSTPKAFERLMVKAEDFNCSLVVGTTALKVGDIDRLKAYAKKKSVVYARNFSKGILIMKNIINYSFAFALSAFILSSCTKTINVKSLLKEMPDKSGIS